RRQALYARGFVALDRLAKDHHKSTFVDMSSGGQTKLLQYVDRRHREWAQPISIHTKIKTKLVILYHKWTGLSQIVELFPRLVDDVMQAFYTNRVSWVWLDYDGPPMRAKHSEPPDRRSSMHEAEDSKSIH